MTRACLAALVALGLGSCAELDAAECPTLFERPSNTDFYALPEYGTGLLFLPDPSPALCVEGEGFIAVGLFGDDEPIRIQAGDGSVCLPSVTLDPRRAYDLRVALSVPGDVPRLRIAGCDPE